MKKSTKLALAFGAALIVIVVTLFQLMAPWPAHKTDTALQVEEDAEHGDSHDNEHGSEHNEGSKLEMSRADLAAKGIVIGNVATRALSEEVTVPGEVAIDLYSSAQITPRITAQVVARHAKLGDAVGEGQRLVTLSSVEMADAQGALIVSNREWDRVRNLGRDVVSERRYVEAQVAAEQARAKVIAYGMTRAQAKALAESGDGSRATGTFELLAPQSGTVVSDNFVVGEVVEAGRVLFQITDESRVWVRAQLTPEQAAHIDVGTPARVMVDSGHSMPARVVQTYHELNEITRTLPIRIEVENEHDTLHSGQFVNVALEVGVGFQTLAVPDAAVILMDGTPTVFKVEDGSIHPTPVVIGERRDGWVEVKDGLTDADAIATSNVFLLKSLIQKSLMGEGHAH